MHIEIEEKTRNQQQIGEKEKIVDIGTNSGLPILQKYCFVTSVTPETDCECKQASGIRCPPL